MPDTVAVAMTEASQVGEARRAALGLARRLGFDEATSGKLALVVTEAANNLVKHARDGLVLLQPIEAAGAAGVEVLALDKGPGMADLERCLRDGFSTAGSPGTGLGAIVRLAAFTDFYSRPTGTAVLARLWSGAPPSPPAADLCIGAVNLPKAGEQVCGDTWAATAHERRRLLLLADGLGHGPLAAEAAQTAARIFHENSHRGPAEILQTAHAALRSTRGAAVAIAEVDLEGEQVRFAGVGNIAGTVLAGNVSHSMVSYNGTLGYQMLKLQELVYPFPKGALLVMHSDGLASRWSLDGYPGLLGRDPALAAGVLYRDFQRGRDDVTVLAARAAKEVDR
jgi:anti-sigma regulatory factor (Ser/Thr protein kinase)